MSNGQAPVYASLRDANGNEMSNRMQVPYTGDPANCIFIITRDGVPQQLAFFDSPVGGMLLQIRDRSNPSLRWVQAGQTIQLLTFPP